MNPVQWRYNRSQSSQSQTMASPSHLFSPKGTLSFSFSRSSPPSRSLSNTSFAIPNSNSRTQLHRHLHLVCASIRKLSEAEPIPIPQDLEEQLDGRIPVGPGVYGVYDSNGELQFIGTSRSISNSIKRHRRLVPEMCFSVKVGPTGKNPELNDLRDAFNTWIKEHISSTGQIPPGNASENDVWAAPPMNLRLVPGQRDPTESQEELIKRLLKEHNMVVFIHGPPREAKKGHDLEYYASTKVLGLLISHGLDFVTVDLIEECHSGLQQCLHDSFSASTCPQVFVGGKLVGGEEEIKNLADFGKLHTLSSGLI